MEYSQFGDTECAASQIKQSWVNLAQQPDGLLTQFNKLANVVDDRKVIDDFIDLMIPYFFMVSYIFIIPYFRFIGTFFQDP